MQRSAMLLTLKSYRNLPVSFVLRFSPCCLFSLLSLVIAITCISAFFVSVTQGFASEAPIPRSASGPLTYHHQYAPSSPFPQMGFFSLQQHALASALLHKHLGLQHVPFFQPPPNAASTSLPTHLAPWPAYYSAPPPPPPVHDVIAPPTSSAAPSRTEPLRIPPPAHISMAASGSGSGGSSKDAMMTSSIESLRLRARQHTANLGLYETIWWLVSLRRKPRARQHTANLGLYETIWWLVSLRRKPRVGSVTGTGWDLPSNVARQSKQNWLSDRRVVKNSGWKEAACYSF